MNYLTKETYFANVSNSYKLNCNEIYNSYLETQELRYCTINT